MSTYVLERAKCEFIETHFFQWSLSKPTGFLPDWSRFLELTHPAELFYLASIYNWDDGEVVLEWVLESDLCTRSTANLLFWRAAPDWYLRCDIEDETTCPGFNLAGFKVIRKIMQKYRDESFSPFSIQFGPKGEIETICEKTPRWTFPPGVYDIIEGVEVLMED